MKSKKIICGIMAVLFAFSFSSCAFLENFQTDTQAQLDELNAKLEQQAQEINGLQANNATLTETVNGLQADKETLSNEVNGLKADKNELTETVNGLLEDKDELTETVNGLSADKDALLEELNALKAYKETLTAELNETEKDNELLLKELNATEEQMEIIFQKLETSNAELYEEVIEWYYETYAPFGVVCTLAEAYEYALLTRDDLMSIAYYQNGGRTYNEDIMSKDYTPQPKNPETLDADLQRKIKETIEYEDGYYWLVTYYGCYNGVYVLRTYLDAFLNFITLEGIYFLDGATTRVYIPQEAYPELVKQIREERGY